MQGLLLHHACAWLSANRGDTGLRRGLNPTPKVTTAMAQFTSPERDRTDVLVAALQRKLEAEQRLHEAYSETDARRTVRICSCQLKGSRSRRKESGSENETRPTLGECQVSAHQPQLLDRQFRVASGNRAPTGVRPLPLGQLSLSWERRPCNGKPTVRRDRCQASRSHLLPVVTVSLRAG